MTEERITLLEIEATLTRGSSHFYLQTTLKDEGKEGFALVLTDGLKVWEGLITEDELDKLSTQRQMDYNSYVEQTKAAFTQESVAELSFEYQLTLGADDSALLMWKKHVGGGDIKFQLGKVKLRKSSSPDPVICSVLSQCIKTTHRLSAQIQSLEVDNERLSKDRANVLKRLDRCVTTKEELEKDLYTKFVAILNSKKERIRFLMENRNDSLDGTDSSPRPGPSSGDVSQISGQTRKHEDSANGKHELNSASDGQDTDEESHSRPKQQKKTSSPKVAHPAHDSSLTFGDDDNEDKAVVVPIARRPRRQTQVKNQTPTVPTLPRVSSSNSALSNRPGSVARKGSLRKSGSGSSKKSSDNLDPDDLLDNL